ncbi:MAG: tryptophan 7-halogenase [Isosphaerales bacterium]
MVERVLVLGGGTAGLLTAIALKTKIPRLRVTLLRSDDPGTIGVGEGTTPQFRELVHRYLGIGLPEFYLGVAPTPKLGTRFVWGPRAAFNLPFGSHVLRRPEGLARPLGFYCDEDMDDLCPSSSLMSACRAFPVADNGSLVIVEDMAYHLDNERLVAFLELHATKLGIERLDETIRDVKRGEQGVNGLVAASGVRFEADLYVDSSGSRSLLLGQTLGEPLAGYQASLFCDRAVVGTRERVPHEPIRPYTTVETMNAGWCWQVEHEERVTRGYVFASDFLTDDEAEHEFRAKDPRVQATSLVKFVSGRRRNAWVQNVVGVGDASGFVEPLAATSLHVISHDAWRLTEILLDAKLNPGPAARVYNVKFTASWDAIRDFLALHYRFNTRLDTPFWRACRADVDLCGASELVSYYQEEGPNEWGPNILPPTHSSLGFTADACFTLLLGQRVPYRKPYEPSDDELRELATIRLENRALALNAFEPGRALKVMRDPRIVMSDGPAPDG